MLRGRGDGGRRCSACRERHGGRRGRALGRFRAGVVGRRRGRRWRGGAAPAASAGRAAARGQVARGSAFGRGAVGRGARCGDGGAETAAKTSRAPLKQLRRSRRGSRARHRAPPALEGRARRARAGLHRGRVSGQGDSGACCPPFSPSSVHAHERPLNAPCMMLALFRYVRSTICGRGDWCESARRRSCKIKRQRRRRRVPRARARAPAGAIESDSHLVALSRGPERRERAQLRRGTSTQAALAHKHDH